MPNFVKLFFGAIALLNAPEAVIWWFSRWLGWQITPDAIAPKP